MLTATRVAVLDTAANPVWVEWEPEGQRVFYLKRASAPEQTYLAIVEAQTGRESITRQCPPWLLSAIQSGDAYRSWSQFCDNVTAPPTAPVILSFTIEPTAVYPGESATLRWTTSGGTAATLEQNTNGTFHDALGVPLSGTMSVSVEEDQRQPEHRRQRQGRQDELPEEAWRLPRSIASR